MEHKLAGQKNEGGGGGGGGKKMKGDRGKRRRDKGEMEEQRWWRSEGVEREGKRFWHPGVFTEQCCIII